MQRDMSRERPNRDEFTFFHPLRVRWAEVDSQGIVFNPNYFVYADIAMTEYMRSAGFPYPSFLHELGSDLFAVRAEAEFVGSATYDDALELATRVDYIGRTSFRFRTCIFRGDELLATLHMTYVNAARDDKTPAPLPEVIVAKIIGYERSAPARKS
jgi:acyl-CoA thioester hydrolase